MRVSKKGEVRFEKKELLLECWIGGDVEGELGSRGG